MKAWLNIFFGVSLFFGSAVVSAHPTAGDHDHVSAANAFMNMMHATTGLDIFIGLILIGLVVWKLGSSR